MGSGSSGQLMHLSGMLFLTSTTKEARIAIDAHKRRSPGSVSLVFGKLRLPCEAAASLRHPREIIKKEPQDLEDFHHASSFYRG